MTDPQLLAARFQSRFGERPQIYRAPGRVNLLGDHTDYNDGFVLPAAIDFCCYAAISHRPDGEWVAFSENVQQTARLPSNQQYRGQPGEWSRYPWGVIQQLRDSGYQLRGANICVSTDVPMGAGLSSSAAIEVASANALLGISGYQVEPSRVALLCQQAENNFAGTRCGIMDQFASCNGRMDHALFIDCRSLEYRAVPLPAGMQLVICNTMVQRQLGSNESEYNRRRAECEEGVRVLAAVLPKVRALRDVTLADLQEHRGRLTSTVYRRCRHVITENERVTQMVAALAADDADRIGELMDASHRSLREDYEVSGPELELMVKLAVEQQGVQGARMTGAGFGGCTVNLVDADFVSQFENRVAAAYFGETGRRPEIYVCEASDGAGRVEI
jgi:galactokinase